jgi:hypothetical protein
VTSPASATMKRDTPRLGSHQIIPDLMYLLLSVVDTRGLDIRSDEGFGMDRR